MLAARVIPTLLYKGRSLYKGSGFDAWRQVGVVAQAVRVHQARGVDELIMLDIAATPQGSPPDYALIQELTDGCFMPLTVGGGVRSVDDVNMLLNYGADKVAICTAIATVPRIIEESANRFGSQAIVAAIDYTYVNQEDFDRQRPCVAVASGKTAIATKMNYSHMPMHPAQWALMVERAGAGEILLTSIDRDGSMRGYDIEIIQEVSQSVNIPVIASGGCSSYNNMLDAIRAGASAVAVGALFQFSDHTPAAAVDYLADNGIEVRRVH